MLEQSHSIHHTTPISPGVLFGLIALDITGEPHLPWAQVYGLDTPSLKQPHICLPLLSCFPLSVATEIE